jgi:hypothetical protein
MANKGEIARKDVGEVGDAIKAGKKQSVSAAGSALAARGGGSDQTEVSRMGDAGVAEAPKVEAADKIDVSPAGDTTEMTLGELGKKLDRLTDMHGELMSCMKSYFEGKVKPETQGAETGDVPGGTTEVAEENANPASKSELHELQDDDAPSSDPAVYKALKVLRAENSKMRSTLESASKQLAETRGEVMGLRKAQDVLKAEREQQALVAGARNRLAAVGFDLESEPEVAKEIETAAKQGKPVLDALVKGYARAAQNAAPALPTYGHEAALEGAEIPEDMPSEVAELIAKGGETAKAAKTLYRSWQGMSVRERDRMFANDIANFLYDRDPSGRVTLAKEKG